MNGSSSASGEAYPVVPSLMSFIGLETSANPRQQTQQHPQQQQQQHQQLCWSDLDAAAANQAISLHHHYYTQAHLNPTVAGGGGVTTAAAPSSSHPLLLGGGCSSSPGTTNPYFDSSQVATPLLPVPNYPASLYGGTPTASDYQHQWYGMGVPPVAVKREMQDICYADPRLVGQQLGLNLGHRTYFSSTDAAAIDRLFRRSRIYQVSHHQVPRCQAEGCKADLSGAKHYHRRHKVCEYHSKATVVVTGGLQQRFCQQCSRFHVLTEFDEAKRSCRKRLADHNRRRRKPQQQTSAARSTSTASDPSDEPSSNFPSSSSTDNNAGQSSDVVMDMTAGILVAKNNHNKGVFSSSCTSGTVNGGTAAAGTFHPTSSSSMMGTGGGMGSSSSSYVCISQKDGRADSNAAHSRSGPQALLSLGGEAGGSSSSAYHDHHHLHHQMRTHRAPFLVMSQDGGGSSDQHQHRREHHNPHSSTAGGAEFFNPSMSSSLPGHPHNFFCPSPADEGHQAAATVGSDQSHNHGNVHLGQGLFEMDFM